VASTSERATAQIEPPRQPAGSTIPPGERLISEEFRLVAKAWVEAEAEASFKEDTKSAVLAQKMIALGDMPVSRAEMVVKASSDWVELIREIVEAKRHANLKRVQMEYIRMKFSEWQSLDANGRAEKRLTR
jgi:hypothetical protein